MARPSSSFTSILHHQNLRTIQSPSTQIRNICTSGNNSNRAEEYMQNQDQLLQHQDHQNFSEIAKEVSKIIRTQPRWEHKLLSDFPSVNFVDSNFFLEVLKHQNSALLSLRFFYWLSSYHDFTPDEFSCNMIFSSLVKTRAANAAKAFLNLTNFNPEPSCLEAYIQCLCENGLIEEALDVLDQLKRVGTCPSLVTWNSALLASTRARRADIVWKLYGKMMECGVTADIDTVGYLIQAFCFENNVSKGYELLREALGAGSVPSNAVFNKLIYGFCRDKYYSRVSALLHTMIAKGRTPDIYTYQEIILGLCKRKMRPEGFRIFNDLKDRGYAPDRVMYTTTIHGLCKMKCLGEARKLWFEMIRKGIIPSEYTYNALIYGFCKIGEIEEAQKFYKEMCDRGYGETTVSYNTMIRGLCLCGRIEEACDLFDQMSQRGIARDVISYNILIQGFCNEGKIDKGANLLHELLEQGLQPSTASYTALIEILCEKGDVHEAKKLWKNMQSRGVEPAVCTHDFIIAGLSERGYVAEAIEWLDNMLKSRLKPQKETFEKLILCLSRGDKLDDALFVLGYMVKIGYALSEYICHSLVSKLCKDHSHHMEACMGDIIERTYNSTGFSDAPSVPCIP